MKIACIIPSRYASTRLPGKPLRLIAGETLVHRVYERAVQAKLPDVVIVATDHEDIEKEVKSFGGSCHDDLRRPSDRHRSSGRSGFPYAGL